MDAANEICIVITAGQIADDDTIAAGRRGVNELTVSDVDSYMGSIIAGAVEYEVARFHLGNRDDSRRLVTETNVIG